MCERINLNTLFEKEKQSINKASHNFIPDEHKHRSSRYYKGRNIFPTRLYERKYVLPIVSNSDDIRRRCWGLGAQLWGLGLYLLT